MLENQFIQFSEAIDPQDSAIAVPLVNGIETTFFIPRIEKYNDGEGYIEKYSLVTPDGKTEITKPIKASDCIDDFQMPTDDVVFVKISDLSALSPSEKFRIKVDTTHRNQQMNQTPVHTRYSNLLQRHELLGEYSVVKYLCNEDAFGIPFSRRVEEYDGSQASFLSYLQCILPINIHSPQFKQEDKIYTKLNGEQVVLYATISREYEGETDYIPEEWHKKIIAALSCDKVYINGERVTKSGSYDIDWEKCDTAYDGTKLVKATFKVTANVTQRNSNY